jgi:O-antigen/teichoic acid export membrane protein
MEFIKNAKNGQWSGVISLGMGSIIAQSINVIIQPILTRLISPEDLGIYTYIISMATLIIPVASLKLEMLIVADNDDNNVGLLTDVSIMSVIITSIIYLLIILIMLVIGDNSFSDIGIYSLFIPVIVLTNGIRFIFISHNNRHKKYSLISRINILRELAMAAIQVTSGMLSGGVIGQAFGYGLSPLFGIWMQTKDYLRNLVRKNKLSFEEIIKILSKNKKHILYLVPSQFINSFSYALITMSVISLFSTTEMGYYSISVRILGIPLILVSNNVSKVYLQKLSEDLRKGISAWASFVSVIKVFGILSVFGFFILAIIAPSVSEIVFGVGYEEAGKYISILCFMYALRFIASALIGTYVVFNKQNIEIIFNILIVLSGVVIYFITLFLKLSIYSYFTFISIAYGIVYLLVIISFGYLCKDSDRRNGILLK